MISQETYDKHITEEKAERAAIYNLINANDKKRDAQHAEVMKMLEPIAKAFNFKAQLSQEAMASVVRWTKIIGLILSVIALCGIIWRFIIINLPK